MSVIATSTISDALDLNLKEIWQDGLNRPDEVYSKTFNVVNSDKASEKYSYESGFRAMPVKNEGVDAEFDAVRPGVSKTVVNVTYALGYEITEEAIEDNQHSQETFNKLPQALQASLFETVEAKSAGVFNNGFGTNGFDGVPLASASHPVLGGGTQSNTPSTQADLSWTTLQAALTSFEQFIDERGLQRKTTPSLLNVPSASWSIAHEILVSEYKPYTGDNEVNAIKIKNLQYITNRWITDTDSWWLLAAKGEHKLMFQWRVRPGALRRGTDFNSTNLKHLSRVRFGVDYTHYIGTYGSSGG